LPGRTTHRTPAYAAVVRELVELVGVEAPPVDEKDPRDVRRWCVVTMRVVGVAVRRAGAAGEAQEAWFEPMIRAAVHEPDPSFVRDIIRPAIDAYGRRRVRLALLDHLETGAAADAAGAARAWYPTLVGMRYVDGSPTPESVAKRDEFRDLDRRFARSGLRRFVADDDLDVRRCLLPSLPLDPGAWPADMRDLVARATEIARSSRDEYLRHRVEIQAS
jgi:hypothetical protein